LATHLEDNCIVFEVLKHRYQIQCARHVTGISVIYATTLKTHVEQLSTIVGRKMEFHGEVPIEITMLA
jgi:hypothetical protein